jgi:hypothetical protein
MFNPGFRGGNSVFFELRRQATAAEATLLRIVGNRQHMREICAPAARFLGTDHGSIALGAEGLHAVIILCPTLAFNIS